MIEKQIFDYSIPELQDFRAGEVISASKINKTVEAVRRLTRGVAPPRQVVPVVRRSVVAEDEDDVTNRVFQSPYPQFAVRVSDVWGSISSGPDEGNWVSLGKFEGPNSIIVALITERNFNVPDNKWEISQRLPQHDLGSSAPNYYMRQINVPDGLTPESYIAIDNSTLSIQGGKTLSSSQGKNVFGFHTYRTIQISEIFDQGLVVPENPKTWWRYNHHLLPPKTV